MKSAIILTLGLCLLATSGTATRDRDSIKIHPFIGNESACRSCHRKKESLAEPAMACNTYCRSCHRGIEKTHHPVDVRIKTGGDVGLRLNRNGRMTCITCHNLTRSRYDDEAWRAQSLYESVFRKQERYRTFYLEINNNDGNLCRKCH
jgi:hypothetical protein